MQVAVMVPEEDKTISTRRMTIERKQGSTDEQEAAIKKAFAVLSSCGVPKTNEFGNVEDFVAFAKRFEGRTCFIATTSNVIVSGSESFVVGEITRFVDEGQYNEKVEEGTHRYPHSKEVLALLAERE
jgi:hypothetical protein